MKKKKTYIPPRVLDSVKMMLRSSILLGSSSEELLDLLLEIETAGHEVVDHDYDDSGFNHDWK